ncbi:MAG: hypothetical protein IPK52_27135 [Chloroflexi bacterium]|nr:hypothetical protein [Chloroflexota bacterium]
MSENPQSTNESEIAAAAKPSLNLDLIDDIMHEGPGQKPASPSRGSGSASGSTIAEYLSNPIIAGAAGGLAAIVVLSIIALLLPVTFDLPMAGVTLSYVVLLGAAIPLVPLAASFAGEAFAGSLSYGSIAVPAVVAYSILCLVTQAIADPRLATVDGTYGSFGIALILGGFIPVLLFTRFVIKRQWRWYAGLGLVATFSTYIPLLILGGIALVAYRFLGIGRVSKAGCPVCGGSGVMHGGVTCRRCGGSGVA